MGVLGRKTIALRERTQPASTTRTAAAEELRRSLVVRVSGAVARAVSRVEDAHTENGSHDERRKYFQTRLDPRIIHKPAPLQSLIVAPA
jgi:hypothetical protein